jgi:hypothetical protein
MPEVNVIDKAHFLPNKGLLVGRARRGWRIGESLKRSDKAVQHCCKSLTIV